MYFPEHFSFVCNIVTLVQWSVIKSWSPILPSCIINSLRVMHLHGFKTCCLVCDAAAANVAVIKATTGVEGAYGDSKVGPQIHQSIWSQ